MFRTMLRCLLTLALGASAAAEPPPPAPQAMVVAIAPAGVTGAVAAPPGHALALPPPAGRPPRTSTIVRAGIADVLSERSGSRT